MPLQRQQSSSTYNMIPAAGGGVEWSHACDPLEKAGYQSASLLCSPPTRSLSTISPPPHNPRDGGAEN